MNRWLAITVFLLACVSLTYARQLQAPTAGDRVDLAIDASAPGARIDRNIFGQFAEHLGRGVYEGVWVGPDSTIPNTRGIRNDVVAALKALKVPHVRWPGGCFADEYHWRKGIGPAGARPATLNPNWGGVIEPNAFGTHEFMDFLAQIGSEAFLSVNVGSGTPQEAAEWLEYLTTAQPTTLAKERASNGHPAPYKLAYLGIGNENWDCGGNMTPDHYLSQLKIERLMSVAAVEARARGTQHVLSPVIDLGRDPRWGRIEETYGEDPHLVTQMGLAAVRGYQGTGLPLAADKVFATLKHFAGHGSHEGGINTAPPLVSERLLRAELLVPFEAAVKAGAYTVMPSYNEVDGVPAHANRWLLTDILRREWGFTGLVVSDYFGVEQLQTRHRVAADRADAAAQALEAGVDLELPDPYGFSELVGLVKSGRIAEATIDRPVAGILRAKFLAGLFENPYVDPAQAERVANAPDHQALALEAARKSIVLLKNERGILPLDRATLKTLAVIGPNARGVHLGGYSSDPGRGVDVLSGITARAGAGINVVYAEGVRITEHAADWNGDKVVLGDPVQNRARIQEAIKVARQADAIVLVIGTNESVSREAWGDNHLGDVADLRLMSNQEELVEAMLQTGKPVIAVLINGRPLAMPLVADRVSAVVEAWYAGQEGGTAIAEVLFGDVNPGGKLPVTFPRHTGQLPVYYNRRPTSFRSHLDLTREPLWPFGFGLSYTTFRLEDLRVASPTIGPGGRTDVTVRVTNTGSRAGDEVVQLYIRDQVSSVTRPVKELCGFARLTLRPGESRVVSFTLGPAELSLIDRRMQRVVEPGRFEIMVGTSATPTLTGTLDVVVR